MLLCFGFAQQTQAAERRLSDPSAIKSNSDMFPDGFWEQRGYHRILAFFEGGTKVWVAGNGYCYPLEEDGDFQELVDVQQLSDHHFRAKQKGGITVYDFFKTDLTVAPCEAESSTDPVTVFNSLWRQFYDNYTFFNLHGVDWLALYPTYRNLAAEAADENALWAVLTDLLSNLPDGHVSLSANEDHARSWVGTRPTSFYETIADWQKTIGTAANDLCAAEDSDCLYELVRRLAPEHIKTSTLSSDFKAAENDIFIWGAFTQRTAYLFVKDMEIEDDVLSLPKQLERFDALFKDQVIPSLAGFDNLIIDMRFNGGGYDAIALRLAEMLARTPALAFTKNTPGSAAAAPRQSITISPSESVRFSNKSIAVLTGYMTASAAEIFLLAARTQPHIQLIGQPSMGILSDTWRGELPNGWTFSLSNEVYLDPSDELFEGRGIPVDVKFPVYVFPNLLMNFDKLVSAAASDLEK